MHFHQNNTRRKHREMKRMRNTTSLSVDRVYFISPILSHQFYTKFSVESNLFVILIYCSGVSRQNVTHELQSVYECHTNEERILCLVPCVSVFPSNLCVEMSDMKRTQNSIHLFVCVLRLVYWIVFRRKQTLEIIYAVTNLLCFSVIEINRVWFKLIVHSICVIKAD